MPQATVPTAALPRPRSDDPELQRQLVSLTDGLNALIAVFNGARFIEDVTCRAGVTTRIAHGLGRRLRGYVIIRKDSSDAAGHEHDEQSRHSDTDQFLYLRFEGYSPTISLLVF